MTAYCISTQHQREAEWLIDVFMISRWHIPHLGMSFWPSLSGAESRRMSCGWMGLWSNIRVIGDFVVLKVSIVEKLCRWCVLGWRREPLVVLKQGHALCSGGLKHYLGRQLFACCWTKWWENHWPVTSSEPKVSDTFHWKQGLTESSNGNELSEVR